MSGSGGTVSGEPKPAAEPRAGREAARRRLGWRCFNRIAGVVQLIAVVVGMAGVAYEFWYQRPQDRDLRDARLHATIAQLVPQDKREGAGLPVIKILGLLHEDGSDTTDVSVPETTFRMVALAGANLSGAYMRKTEFLCSDWAYDLIGEDGEKSVPCAHLRGVDLTGATLDYARFDYADLRNAILMRASLRHARIENSLLTDAQFDRADMSGVRVKSSDFTRAKFGTRMTIDCRRLKTPGCPKLGRVVFFGAKMPKARFLGATIKFADFATAKLKEAEFGCDGRKNNRECTVVKNTCFHRAVLPKARFRGVTMSNVDLSHADLTRGRFENTTISNAVFSDAIVSGAQFKNVRFENVVFPRELSASAKLDPASAHSLERARVQALDDSSTQPDKRPCASAWRDRLGAWKNAVAFPHQKGLIDLFFEEMYP